MLSIERFAVRGIEISIRTGFINNNFRSFVGKEISPVYKRTEELMEIWGVEHISKKKTQFPYKLYFGHAENITLFVKYTYRKNNFPMSIFFFIDFRFSSNVFH